MYVCYFWIFLAAPKISDLCLYFIVFLLFNCWVLTSFVYCFSGPLRWVVSTSGFGKSAAFAPKINVTPASLIPRTTPFGYGWVKIRDTISGHKLGPQFDAELIGGYEHVVFSILLG